MTRRRWIADELVGDRAALTGEHANHLVRVLRAQVGQEFDIATKSGVRCGQIVSIADDRVEFALGVEVGAPQTTKTTLLLSIFKFDRMEWAIEKCTELGVARIVPVIARRTDSHLAGAAEKRCERWQRIALQASEQSRRSAPPDIFSPLKLQEALKLEGALRIVLSEAEKQTLLANVLAEQSSDGDVLIAVGPEGGWAESELQFFTQAGWISASLGTMILRAETAAIAAAAVVASQLR